MHESSQTKILDFPDLHVGRLFTVLDSHPQIESQHDCVRFECDCQFDCDCGAAEYGVLQQSVQIYGKSDTRFNGLPMRVLAANWPYLTAEVLSNGDCAILDCRIQSFIPIGVEYAASLAPPQVIPSIHQSAKLTRETLALQAKSAEMEAAAEKANEALEQKRERVEQDKKCAFPASMFTPGQAGLFTISPN